MIQGLSILLGILLFIASVTIFFMAADKRKTRENLRYINDKLNSIIRESTKEKVLCVTDDQDIKSLLTTINTFLSDKDKAFSDNVRSQESMKKMLTNISHDLKTPLTVILGYIETIQIDKNLSAEEREVLLARAYEKTQEVLALMNEFFVLSKLESNDLVYDLERLHLNEVVRKNILSFYDILISRGFEVDINIPEEPVYVAGNEEAMSRILQNLISNTVRYGADGHYLAVTLSSDDHSVYLDVTDKGKGIHEVDYDKIFERLVTLEDSRNKQYQGSGLGLTITRRLVEKMNGTISLTSKPFEKTTFSLRFNKLNY